MGTDFIIAQAWAKIIGLCLATIALTLTLALLLVFYRKVSDWRNEIFFEIPMLVGVLLLMVALLAAGATIPDCVATLIAPERSP